MSGLHQQLSYIFPDVPGQFRRCLSVRRFYKKMLEKYTTDTAVSAAEKFTVYASPNITCPRSMEDVAASRRVSKHMTATYMVLEDLFKHGKIDRLYDRKNVSGQIHAIGIFKMVSIASC